MRATMDCQAFDRRLDALLDGACSAEDWREAEAHLAGCPRCARIVEALAGGADDLDPREREALADSVLARTSGPSCGAARDRLCGLVDAELDPTDRALVEAHLAHCSPCTALVRALRLASATLPSFADIAPPPRFLGRCLAATSRRAPLPTWADRAGRWLERLAARPRLGFEVAYLFTIVLVIAFGDPVRAFRDTSARAAALVQPRVEEAIERVASPVLQARAAASARLAAVRGAQANPGSPAPSWLAKVAPGAQRLWNGYVVASYRFLLDRLAELVASAERLLLEVRGGVKAAEPSAPAARSDQ